MKYNKDKLVQYIGDYYDHPRPRLRLRLHLHLHLRLRLRPHPNLYSRPQLIKEDLGIILEYLTPEQTWTEDYLKQYKDNKEWYKEGTYKVHFQKLKQTVYVFEGEIKQYISKKEQ